MLAEGVFILPFVAMLGALFTLAFFYVSYQIAQPLGAALAAAMRLIPVIGDDLGSFVQQGVNALSQWMQSTVANIVQSAERPFIDSINTITNNERTNAYSTRYVQNHIVAQLNRLTLAQQVGVTQPTVTYVHDSVTNTEIRTNTIVTDNYDQSVAYTQDAYNVLASWADSAVQTVYHDVQDAEEHTAQDVAQLSNAILGVQTTAFQAISASAAETLAAATHYTDENYVKSVVLDEQIQDEARREANQARDDAIAVGAAALHPVSVVADSVQAVVTTLVLPAVSELEQFNKDCGIPTCNGLLKLAEGFLSMTDLLGDFELVAWLVQAARDPKGTARELEGDIEDLVNEPLSVINDVFGTNYSVLGR